MASAPAPNPREVYIATIEKLRAHPALSAEVDAAIRERPILITVAAMDIYRFERGTIAGWRELSSEDRAPWTAKAEAKAAANRARMDAWRARFPAGTKFLDMTDVEREDFFDIEGVTAKLAAVEVGGETPPPPQPNGER